jgi:hypothetical protein
MAFGAAKTLKDIRIVCMAHNIILSPWRGYGQEWTGRRLQRERREGVFVMGLEVEREAVGRPVMEN